MRGSLVGPCPGATGARAPMHCKCSCSLQHGARPWRQLRVSPRRGGLASKFVEKPIHSQALKSNKGSRSDIEGASTQLNVILDRMTKLALPYWTTSEKAVSARWKLAGVVGLTLATTGVSVAFSFLGRDFFNALSEKNVDAFQLQLVKYLGGFVIGIPVFVFRGYFQSLVALEWREWMTDDFMKQYFDNRSFYQLQVSAMLDNPDQRIASDVRNFTDAALMFATTILNSLIDLVSFSGILYSIYPPLFVALILYSVGGTVTSLWLGRSLVTLNFNQEAREADMRYNLVRIRENAESIAFYGGEKNEFQALLKRLQAVISNYGNLLVASRNLDFFTSFYRFLIALLPAAVVAPLFFQGKIEFGVITQSSSAFSHILNDVSLVVYQVETLAELGAVVDRLGQFQEALESQRAKQKPRSVSDVALPDISDATPVRQSNVVEFYNLDYRNDQSNLLLELQHVTVTSPTGQLHMVEDLSLKVIHPTGSAIPVYEGEPLLITGESGVGKTSLLRTLAGLWGAGHGRIVAHGLPGMGLPGCQAKSVFFLPQKPYMVLGSLRDQLLYPIGSSREISENGSNGTFGTSIKDDDLMALLHSVRLGHVLDRYGDAVSGSALDYVADWSITLSLGEQQRLAFARLLLAKPRLALLDEATSAVDIELEECLYSLMLSQGVTCVSVGHRPTLKKYHSKALTLEGRRWHLARIQAEGSVGSAVRS